ncbi:unnamed protein product [Vitrella brassicaformis CCMP3155]|uniref:Tyrosine-protein kinase ephrin type A/B receptor-like domain-containing protein n=2 Tax=Vitrella brassicaformis TaxID=1169539 RepID=A0A0G4EWU2_VITBC|nr:unnamed protein product [Vitrella brassicaformis CCMP3155]|eukprot:CEM03233.1 unnamed protein product [Vitrella brassicaformis CCMP3155]
MEREELDLQALFWFALPAQPHIWQPLGRRGDYVIFPAQWHPTVVYDDPVVNSTALLEDWRACFDTDTDISYVQAMALLPLHFLKLTMEMLNVWTDDPIVNADRLLWELSRNEVPTFMGPVRLDRYNRNSGTSAVLVQQQNQKQHAVLPVESASSELVWPLPTWEVKRGCPPGKYIHEARECLPCPPNSFSVSVNAERCSLCPLGHGQPREGQTKCVMCAFGYGNIGGTLDGCRPCLRGSYSDFYGTCICLKCDPGTYADTEASIACTRCPEGETTLAEGSGRPSDCTCQSGFYQQPAANISSIADPRRLDAGMQAALALENSTEHLVRGRCAPCPDGCSCPGGEKPPSILPGYWLPPPSSMDRVHLIDKQMEQEITDLPSLPGFEPRSVNASTPPASEVNVSDGVVADPVALSYEADTAAQLLTLSTFSNVSAVAASLPFRVNPTLLPDTAANDTEEDDTNERGMDILLSLRRHLPFKCVPPSSCPGGDAGACAANREGLVCGRCSKGRFDSRREDGSVCHPCTFRLSFPLAVFLLLCVMLPCAALLIWFANGQVWRNGNSVSFLFTSFQQLGMVTSVCAALPFSVARVFSLFRLMLFDGSPVGLCLACHGLDTFQSQHNFLLSMPLFLVAALVIIYAASQVLHRRESGEWRLVLLGRCLVLASLILMFHMLMITLARIALIPFDCYKHPNGYSSVREFPHVLCGLHGEAAIWRQHLWVSYIGLGAYCGSVVIMTTRFALAANRRGDETGFKEVYGHFMDKFAGGKYWWSVVWMARNLSLALTVTLPHGSIQKVFVASLTTVYLVLLIFVLPWKRPTDVYVDGSTNAIYLHILLISGLSSQGDHKNEQQGKMLVVLLTVSVVLMQGIILGRLALSGLAKCRGLRQRSKQITQSDTSLDVTNDTIGPYDPQETQENPLEEMTTHDKGKLKAGRRSQSVRSFATTTCTRHGSSSSSTSLLLAPADSMPCSSKECDTDLAQPPAAAEATVGQQQPLSLAQRSESPSSCSSSSSSGNEDEIDVVIPPPIVTPPSDECPLARADSADVCEAEDNEPPAQANRPWLTVVGEVRLMASRIPSMTPSTAADSTGAARTQDA